MDLWIRTQKKDQLIHAEEIKIQNNTYDDESQILVSNKHTYQYAGKYKTKDRSLEILNEIQEQIKKSIDIIENKSYTEGNYRNHELNINIPYTKTIVYELPKE